MTSAKKKALVGLGGAVGVSVAAWRTLFPWISYDLPQLKVGKKTAGSIAGYIARNEFVIDMFESSVQRHPKKPFIIFEDRIYTYEFVNEQACRVANIALKIGLKLGDTAAIFLHNEPAFIWTFLGLQKIGVAVAFLNTNNRKKPLVHSIKISDAKVLIVGKGADLFHAVDDIRQEINIPIFLSGLGINEPPAGYQSWDQLMISSSPAEISKNVRAGVHLLSRCCYIYTSGTTGLPKPAIINQAKGIGMSQFLHISGIQPDDITYTVTPLYHSAATLAMLTTLEVGSTMVLRSKFSAHHFFDDCRRHNVTIIQYIGELCRYLLALPESPKDKEHNIKIAIGNGLRADIWEKFVTRFNIKKICEFFGASEGTSAMFSNSGRIGACGRMSPLMTKLSPVKSFLIRYDPSTEGPYRDKNNRCVLCDIGEPGLYIAGIPPHYVEGFYKGPKEMNEKKIIRNAFVDGDAYFNYGDLLYKDKDYFVYFKDRVGDTFRWKGENVSTNEVANTLTKGLDFISDANVYGVSVPGHDGRAGMAAIQLKENEKLTPERLKKIYDCCEINLPNYARPLFIRLEGDTRVTVTFKQHKVDLVKEGFDPTIVKDPLYYLSNQKKSYLPLDINTHTTLLQSKL